MLVSSAIDSCHPTSLTLTQFISSRGRRANITSFAVVNFTPDKASCYDLVKRILRVAQSHGIEIPSTMEAASRDDRWLDCVTEHYSGRNSVDEVSKMGMCWSISFLSWSFNFNSTQ